MDRFKGVGRRLVDQFRRDDVPGLGAEMAYRFLFAIFPFGLFVAALIAFVAPMFGISSATDRLLGALGDNLPPEIASGIRPELEQVIDTTRPGLLSIGALAALWAATGGTLALMKGLNRAYEIEETRSFITKYLVAIGLTLLAAIGVIASFVTIIGGALVTQELASRLGVGGQVWSGVQLLRWPIVFVALLVAVTILYRHAPNARAPWRFLMVGALVFTVGWLVATFALSLYVGNVANYGATYGSLGGVIVLMLWFYVTSIMLVVGGEVAGITANVFEPGSLQQRRDEIAEALPLDDATRTAKDAIGGAGERLRRGSPDEPGRDAREADQTRPVPPGARVPGGASVHAIRRERPED
jgi:membrane protein